MAAAGHEAGLAEPVGEWASVASVHVCGDTEACPCHRVEGISRRATPPLCCSEGYELCLVGALGVGPVPSPEGNGKKWGGSQGCFWRVGHFRVVPMCGERLLFSIIRY